MSVQVKALNGDTTFLLTFSPAFALPSSPALYPGTFSILVDPWLTGTAEILSPRFSVSAQKQSPCISSLRDLPRTPDIILISQDKPDHCHQETLCQLPPDLDRECLIVAAPRAAKKIHSWRYFDPDRIVTLPAYNANNDETVFRMELPRFSPTGSTGEVTIAYIPMKRDISKVHSAVGITYRPPSSVLSANPSLYLDLPATPPLTPMRPRSPFSPTKTLFASPRTLSPSPYHDRERAVSVLYTPHGVKFETIKNYAAHHLVREAALPLDLLLHSFDRVQNPWYLGGNISAGYPGGLEIAKNLLARTWIGAHDADKDNRGISVQQTKIKKFTADEVKRAFIQPAPVGRQFSKINVVSLGPGDEHHFNSTNVDGS